MAEIELHLHEMTVGELLVFAAGVASALTGNESFPEPNPSPGQLTALCDELVAADEEHRQQQAVLTQARIVLDRKTAALREALAVEAAYVQEQSGGSISKMLSANMPVAEGSGIWPFNRIAQVENLAASMGDQPGEIDLSWDPVPRASGYEIEVAYDLTGEGPWEQCGATTASKITLEKLNNRTRYWFRVRAVGEHGDGDWSDAVTKFAP